MRADVGCGGKLPGHIWPSLAPTAAHALPRVPLCPAAARTRTGGKAAAHLSLSDIHNELADLAEARQAQVGSRRLARMPRRAARCALARRGLGEGARTGKAKDGSRAGMVARAGVELDEGRRRAARKLEVTQGRRRRGRMAALCRRVCQAEKGEGAVVAFG